MADPGLGVSRPALPWRVAIVFGATVLAWAYVFHWAPLSREYDRPTHAARAVLTTAITVPLVVLARRLMDRRPWAGLGLPWSDTARRHLLLGVACWTLPAAVGFAMCLGLGWARVSLRTSVAEAFAIAALLLVLVFLYEALPEELVFRGYLQRNLVTALPPWLSVLGQALLFVLAGFALGTARSPGRLVIFLAFGLLLGAFRVATGDIWAGIGFHMAFQAAAQLLVGEGAVFEVEDGRAALELVGLGLPFAFGWTALNVLHKATPD